MKLITIFAAELKTFTYEPKSKKTIPNDHIRGHFSCGERCRFIRHQKHCIRNHHNGKPSASSVRVHLFEQRYCNVADYFIHLV